jgi:hypothetical protein
MVLLIVLGSMLALRGHDILMGFVRMLGGLALGGVGAFLGLRLGDYFGGDWHMIYALSLGALGFLIGFLFGPKLLQVVLSVTIFTVGGGVGYLVAEEMGGEGLVPLLTGIVVGLVAAWIMSSIARKLLLAATITLGSAMVGTGILVLIMNDISMEHAGLLSFGAFMIMALTGFLVQRREFMDAPRRR